MAEDEPETWLTVREAAARLKVTEPRLRRAMKRTGTGTLRETETKTGTRPGVCVRVSDLAALTAAMETGTETGSRREPEQEQSGAKVYTFSGSGEPAVPSPGASRPAAEDTLRAVLAHNADLQRQLAEAYEREQRQGEQLTAALQIADQQQRLAADLQRQLAEVTGLPALPAPTRVHEANDGKNGYRASVADGGNSGPASVKVTFRTVSEEIVPVI
jgi:hypothetical protein